VAPSIRKKLAITSPTSGGRSVGIVRSRTKTMEFLVFTIIIILLLLLLLLSFLETENTAVGTCRTNHATPSIRKKLALISTSGGRSVRIVRSRTMAACRELSPHS
jgi:hypothetical protein